MCKENRYVPNSVSEDLNFCVG